MKINLSELKKIVGDAIAEAKKKKGKEPKAKEVQPKGYVAAEGNDFSKPQGVHNLYRREGASNMGPYTSESALRQYVKSIIDEALGGEGGPMHREDGMDDESPQAPMHRDPSRNSENDRENRTKIAKLEAMNRGPQIQREAVQLQPHLNVWENVVEAARWYNKEGWNLAEKRIGFKKLAGKLAHKKGVRNPRALAASIGRKKYGAKKMAKMAAAGRK